MYSIGFSFITSVFTQSYKRKLTVRQTIKYIFYVFWFCINIIILVRFFIITEINYQEVTSVFPLPSKVLRYTSGVFLSNENFLPCHHKRHIISYDLRFINKKGRLLKNINKFVVQTLKTNNNIYDKSIFSCPRSSVDCLAVRMDFLQTDDERERGKCNHERNCQICQR